MEHPPTAAAAAPAPAVVMGEKSFFCPLRPKSEQGVVMDLEPRDLRILQMVEANSVCTLFEYYKLGLSMGFPDDVLTRNTGCVTGL